MNKALYDNKMNQKKLLIRMLADNQKSLDVFIKRKTNITGRINDINIATHLYVKKVNK